MTLRLSFGLMLLACACGSTAAPGGAGDDGGLDADATAPGDASGSETNNADTTLTPDATDAGLDALPADGAPTDAPVADGTGEGGGTIPCGASQCTAGVEVCCTAINGGTCTPIGDGAPCGSHDFTIACERPSDCPGGQVCCFEFHHGCDLNSFCYSACDPVIEGYPGIPACNTTNDCGDGGPCAPHTCMGMSIQTCSPPLGACCP